MFSKSRLANVGIGIATLFSAASLLRAQTAPAPTPKFEVATVKPNNRGGGSYVQALPGRLVMTNLSVRTLILLAYGIQGYQIVGEPSWVASDNYDIQAKAEGDTTVNQMEGPMLRTLLEDRFKLTVHRETRQLPVFELTAVNGGVKLKPTKEGSCTPYSPGSPPPPAPTPGAPARSFCGYFDHVDRVDGPNHILDGAGISIQTLVANLSRLELHRSVIDKTGLTGTFEMHLKWASDAPTNPAGPGISDSPGAAPSDNLSDPSIYTALQEQMGLRLAAARGPVDVLVVDHIEKPSDN